MGVFVYVGSEPGRVWDGIIQKFTIGHYHANFAHFQIALLSREEQEGELFSLWQMQDGWKHLRKLKCKFIMTF